jgi:hypothetical protein
VDKSDYYHSFKTRSGNQPRVKPKLWVERDNSCSCNICIYKESKQPSFDPKKIQKKSQQVSDMCFILG